MCSACLKSAENVFWLSFARHYHVPMLILDLDTHKLLQTYKQMLSTVERAESHVFLQVK